jgi:serine phosphatase RsbU (regulator of sigma subunit)
LTDGLTLQELWTQFRRETGQSFRLYSRELDRRFEGAPERRRYLGYARGLLRAMVLKLSPARRLALLLAFVLLVVGWVTPADFYAVIGTFLLVALLGLELADRVAMKRDLQIAREIQGWLVPHAPPEVPGYEVAFATRPANTVAGDYYDAFRRPSSSPGDGTWVLVVADVAGKGMPAALLMASFQSSLHTLVQEPLPLSSLVRRLNVYCCAHSLDGRRFTTAILAQLDPATGELEYVNAGHNAPLLRRADGRLETLEAGGVPLGIRADESYAMGRVRLAPGDVLVCYTDGVVEARGAAGEDYGEDRLRALLREPAPAGAAEVLRRVMAAIEAYTGDAARADDETCLVLSAGR